MAIIQASRPPGSGGSGQELAWEFDSFDQTDPFTAGSLLLTLSQEPLDENAIILYSQDNPIPPGAGTWEFVAPDQIQINFSADPSTDAPDGVWNFSAQYPYQA